MADWAEQRRRRDEARRAVVMALPALPVRHHARIEAAHEGDVRVCASVGAAGEVIAVWSAAADLPAVTATTVQPGWASFPDPLAARPVTARVTVHAPATVSVTSLSGLGLAHFTAQPMPGGSILLVGARSRWRSDGPDRNAVIYGADGRVLAEETLGELAEPHHQHQSTSGQRLAGRPLRRLWPRPRPARSRPARGRPLPANRRIPARAARRGAPAHAGTSHRERTLPARAHRGQLVRTHHERHPTRCSTRRSN